MTKPKTTKAKALARTVGPDALPYEVRDPDGETIARFARLVHAQWYANVQCPPRTTVRELGRSDVDLKLAADG